MPGFPPRKIGRESVIVLFEVCEANLLSSSSFFVGCEMKPIVGIFYNARGHYIFLKFFGCKAITL